ncbi:MAG: acyl-CoA thioesterase [Ignavibacteriales bacterium]|nr:MAG: acyl-CoA thioesterase [Ignavibacteriales bacterium]
MGRIKILLPDKFQFKTEMKIRVTDINYGGHLGNDSVLSIMHEARIRFLGSLGYAESDVEGTGIMMTDCHINYTSQGFYGDEIIIDVSVPNIERNGCDFIYRITNKNSLAEIARGTTSIVFYSYTLKKLQNTPEKFRIKITELPFLD